MTFRLCLVLADFSHATLLRHRSYWASEWVCWCNVSSEPHRQCDAGVIRLYLSGSLFNFISAVSHWDREAQNMERLHNDPTTKAVQPHLHLTELSVSIDMLTQRENTGWCVCIKRTLAPLICSLVRHPTPTPKPFFLFLQRWELLSVQHFGEMKPLSVVRL